MRSALWLIIQIIDIYMFVLIIGVVLSWLIAFDVLNVRNRFVRIVYDITNALMNPLLRPIRRFLPTFGGLDLSPLVLFLLLGFARSLIIEYWPRGI